MNLNNYTTKTEIIPCKNPDTPVQWTTAIDYGSSAVKGFAPNKVFCFSSCARLSESIEEAPGVSDNEIILRDGGETWLIGDLACNQTAPEGTASSEESTREKDDEIFAFQAVMKAGLGIALLDNNLRQYKGEAIIIRACLPSVYAADSMFCSRFMNLMAGDYSFELKIGREDFIPLKFRIDPNNIGVCSQSMGGALSAVTERDASFMPGAVKILESKTLVFNAGFKALDLFDLPGSYNWKSLTLPNLGMYEVFRITADAVNNLYRLNIDASKMQEVLSKEYLTEHEVMNGVPLKAGIEYLLGMYSKWVLGNALFQLDHITNTMRGYEYLIVSGGAGEAWFPSIKASYSNRKQLTVISANRNDTSLSNVYSNVRGIYLHLV